MLAVLKFTCLPNNQRALSINLSLSRSIEMTGAPLTGKVALITGSTQGIGLGIARSLARVGCSLVLHGSRSADRVEALLSELQSSFGVEVHYKQADLASTAEAEALVHFTIEKFGCIDILGSYAQDGARSLACSSSHARTLAYSQQCWRTTRVDGRGVFGAGLGPRDRHQPQRGLPHDPPRGTIDEEPQLGPHHQRLVGTRSRGIAAKERLWCVAASFELIITITISANQRYVCVCVVAAKHGLNGLTKAVALELADANVLVTCNAICPGTTYLRHSRSCVCACACVDKRPHAIS